MYNRAYPARQETEIGIKVDIKDVDNLSIDCFFLYTLSNEPDFKKKVFFICIYYYKGVKGKSFLCLSGIYFWETIRCNTAEQIRFGI